MMKNHGRPGNHECEQSESACILVVFPQADDRNPFLLSGQGLQLCIQGDSRRPCSADRNKDGDFRIGEEQWVDIPLAQIV